MIATSHSRIRWSAALALVMLLAGWPAYADEPSPAANVATAAPEAPAPASADRKAHKRRTKEVTTEQEDSILKFVAENHPELATLLQTLREKDSQQYQVALRDLRATTERIGRLKTKNPARYENELEIWKVQSRIRLLRARRSLQADEDSEKELRTLLELEVDSRLKLLKLERSEQAARLEKLDEEIRLTQENRAKDVDFELQRALKKTRARPTSTRSKPSNRRKAASSSEAPESGLP